MEETKIIYYLEDQETPYLVKLLIPPENVTLKDFKNALNRQNYKFFFKSMDVDFGVVKEEVADDDARLPCCNGRVISWLISTEGSVMSDTKSQHSINSDNNNTTNAATALTQSNMSTPIINSNLNSQHTQQFLTSNSSENNIENGRAAVNSMDNHHHQDYRKHHRIRDLNDDTTTETESIVSTLRDLRLHRSSSRRHYNSFNHHLQNHNRRSLKMPPNHKVAYNHHHYDASSIQSSDLDATTFFDSENDDQFSSVTDTTTRSSRRYGMDRKKRLKHRVPAHEMDRASSVSSLTESTMSLNIITVTLNMDTVNFLGISIVGQSNKGGDGGIYVGSIMNGGAVAQDGRIEPGDMILQVNDVSFENMSNDDAVKVLREAVMKPGPIKLVVAKCWDPNPQGYFTVSKQEPIRPIDPSAWVAHTAAMTGGPGTAGGTYAINNHHHFNPAMAGRYPPPAGSISTFGSNSSLSNSIPESDTRYGNEQLNLTVNTDMETVVRAMSAPDSGLDIRDRNWLKITIPSAFIGSDVVDWLFNHVEGFPDRRDARKYACAMLKYGYIRHAVNKIRFSEQCYYIFGEFNGPEGCGGNLFTLNEESEDFDSVSELDRDTLGPLKSMPPAPSYISSSNTSGSTNSQTSGIASQTEKNYHLYYPPMAAAGTANSIISGTTSFMDNTDNHTYITSGINSNYTSAASITQQNHHHVTQLTQYTNNQNYTVNTVTTNNSGGSNMSKTENKSIKSSDNSSSGNGSDLELISKNNRRQQRHQQQQQQQQLKIKSGHLSDSTSSLNSFYQIAQFQQQQQQQTKTIITSQQQQQQRSLGKVPSELRVSKQSFHMAMGNPCEFFVDVM